MTPCRARQGARATGTTTSKQLPQAGTGRAGPRHPTNGDDGDMPKMKTHSGAGKRFRLSGTGKVMRRRANRAHYLEH